ncbi:hypothetical protein ACQJBY_032615 [Aegilops geniculata]
MAFSRTAPRHGLAFFRCCRRWCRRENHLRWLAQLFSSVSDSNKAAGKYLLANQQQDDKPGGTRAEPVPAAPRGVQGVEHISVIDFTKISGGSETERLFG